MHCIRWIPVLILGISCFIMATGCETEETPQGSPDQNQTESRTLEETARDHASVEWSARGETDSHHRTESARSSEQKADDTGKVSSSLRDALQSKDNGVHERKVIYQADVEMRVKDFRKARKGMEDAARKAGGYLVNGSESRSGRTVTGSLVFRIPQEQFQAFLRNLESFAEEMPSQNITGTDVTEEYVDLQSRLKAKKAVEDRLLKMMKQAESAEDLLKISDQLSQVQEEIEQLKGRIHYLDNQSAFSTVNVHMTQELVLHPPKGEPDTWKQIVWSFSRSVTWMEDLLKGLLVAAAASAPPLAVAAVLGLPALWWWRGRNNRADGPADPPPTDSPSD